MPDEWLRSAGTAEFFGMLASAPISLLMLDYDGTLAPFTHDRLQAIPYPGVKARLEMLAKLAHTRLILISGRKAAELRQLLDLTRPVEIWGSHGREHLSPDGTYQMEALTTYEQEGLDRVRHALEKEFDAEVIEVKPSSVAVHWRAAEKSSGATAIREKMEQLCATLPAATAADGRLNLLAFDGGLELRAGTINKGHAVTRILEQFPAGTPAAFLGDDTTDEDAFAVLAGHGLANGRLAVLVKQEPRTTLARLWLSPPEELLHFLDAWIAAVEMPR